MRRVWTGKDNPTWFTTFGYNAHFWHSPTAETALANFIWHSHSWMPAVDDPGVWAWIAAIAAAHAYAGYAMFALRRDLNRFTTRLPPALNWTKNVWRVAEEHTGDDGKTYQTMVETTLTNENYPLGETTGREYIQVKP